MYFPTQKMGQELLNILSSMDFSIYFELLPTGEESLDPTAVPLKCLTESTTIKWKHLYFSPKI